MRTIISGRILTIALVLFLFGVQIACGLPANTATEQENQSEAQEPDVGGEAEEQGAMPAQENGGNTVDDQSEVPIEPEFGSETLPCPQKGATLILGFDHALTLNYLETSISHFLHQGWLTLKVADDNGTIQSEGSPSLTYTMEGRMSDECTLNAEGTMMPSAHGSCENGVVSLFIDENWLPMSGEMECVDSDGDVYIMPFDVPPMGLQHHTGQNGEGEIFYLVEGGEGYSTMRPFVEGEGYHTWTLYTEEVPLVPLVP